MMNLMTWIDKQISGSSHGRLGVRRRARTIDAARESRAPPAAGVITRQTVAQEE